MATDTEIDMKEVELNETDSEKQHTMGNGQGAGGEENGSVELRIPENKVTFTGLSKEELMKVANTPGWVRIRWVLLVLFWLSFVGMLAGAIVLIVQAPRCKAIPEIDWWNEGPLYQISDVKAFSDGLKGLEAKLDAMNQLMVKGLVLGPLHTIQADQPNNLSLTEIDPTQGNQEDLVHVVEKAHKKGISVVLDLTPNYPSSSPWFSPVDAEVIEKVKAAAEYWLSLGVDGIKIFDPTVAFRFDGWSKLQAAVHGNRTVDGKKRMLMGVVQNVSAAEVSRIINYTSADLVLSDLLSSQSGGVERIKAMDTLNSQRNSLAWGLGAAQQEQLSKQATTPGLTRLYQLLLFTMPGTPVFTYGDGIGLDVLQGSGSPKMVWDIEKEPTEGAAVNETAEAERKERIRTRKWFIKLSDLRHTERSLLHGDYYPLHYSASALSFLRVWDPSERFITAVNWGAAPEKFKFTLPTTEGVQLPQMAKVVLSTDEDLKEDSTISLDQFTLGPERAVLLHFPASD